MHFKCDYASRAAQKRAETVNGTILHEFEKSRDRRFSRRY
jgi:hypothetical protein